MVFPRLFGKIVRVCEGGGFVKEEIVDFFSKFFEQGTFMESLNSAFGADANKRPS